MKIAFICIHNSCRSQMAEALANFHAKKMQLNLKIYSAGSEKNRSIHPKAIHFLAINYGIDMSDHYVKTIDVLPKDIDIVVSMGCGIKCPALKGKYFFDFQLEDPSNFDDLAFQESIKILESKVIALLESIKSGTLGDFRC